MAQDQFKRKLTTIFSADVAGYSRLMGEDEAATVKTLEQYKGIMSELIRQHRGHVVDSPGDNLLAEFTSVVQKKQFVDFAGKNAANAPGNMSPIGTGPYIVKDFKPGDVVIYEINPNYRDPDKPFFKEVQLKGGGDAAQRLVPFFRQAIWTMLRICRSRQQY